MRERIADITSLLSVLGMHGIESEHGGADIGPMTPAGVPQVGLVVDSRTYFDYHHTDADTLDKVDPAQLADDVAAVAVLAYIAAGVPDDALVVEDRALTTAQNATFTAALVAPLAVRRVWLVSQPFHGRRAARLFRRAGLTPSVWHIAGSTPELRWIAREYAAW